MESPAARLVAAVMRAVAAERLKRGYTHEELAIRAGIDRSHVGLLEKGQRSPSLEVALNLAWGLDIPLSSLLPTVGEGTREATGGCALVPTDWAARTLPADGLQRETELTATTGLTSAMLAAAISKAYSTLDLIDAQLVRGGSPPLAHTVELANLSSMLGNVLAGAIADCSGGIFKRNGPHKYPDLLTQRKGIADVELKTALETNKPKGHLPKPGHFMTVRYVLGDRKASHKIGDRGDTIWIWELKVGVLKAADYDLSNTEGDSGKTAVVKTEVFKAMPLVYLDRRFIPHKPRKGKLYPGHN